MAPDIFADIEEAGEKDKGTVVDLGPITNLVKRQVDLEAKSSEDKIEQLNMMVHNIGASVKDVEAVLKARKKTLFGIRQIQVPELMKEFGLESLTTLDGCTVQIKGDVSVTVKDQGKLYDYLREQGAGDLIKKQIISLIDSEETRGKVLEALDNLDCPFESKDAVHAATLKKYVKDQLKKGVKIPEDILNTFEYQYSKIK